MILIVNFKYTNINLFFASKSLHYYVSNWPIQHLNSRESTRFLSIYLTYEGDIAVVIKRVNLLSIFYGLFSSKSVLMDTNTQKHTHIQL